MRGPRTVAASSALVLSRVCEATVNIRIERDCKFISGRRSRRRPSAAHVHAVVLTLRVFFSRRASALPFCSQVDQLSLYAMLLLFFSTFLYSFASRGRSVRKNVRFACVREFACRVMSTPAIENEL